MTQVETKAVLPEPTDVRFSMRSMLTLMAVTAIVATALGAFLRQFPAEAQVRLWIFWGVLLALISAIAFANARVRFRAEKKAGRVLFQLVPHSYFFPHAPRFASMLAATFLFALAPAAWVAGSFVVSQPDPSKWLQVLNTATIYGLISLGAGIAYFWWDKRVRLGENGVVIRRRFLPWSHLERYYWDACHRDVVVMQFEPLQFVTVRVPKDQRDSLTALLKEKQRGNPSKRATATPTTPPS